MCNARSYRDDGCGMHGSTGDDGCDVWFNRDDGCALHRHTGMMGAQ